MAVLAQGLECRHYSELLLNLGPHCSRDYVVCGEEDSARGRDIEVNILTSPVRLHKLLEKCTARLKDNEAI